MKPGVPRLNLHQRAQHGLLVLAVAGALATGLASGRTPGGGAVAIHAWHLACGFGAFVLLGYHLLYLVVRGYVESRGWSEFPLRWRAADLAAAVADVRFVLGAAAARPEADEYRSGHKASYWWTLVALALLGATGVGIAFWSRMGTLAVLPQVAAIHRGLALLLLGSALWHIYGALTWEGRWWPEWSWLDGELDAEKARLKVPGAWRRHVDGQAGRDPATTAAPEEQTRQRQAQEQVQVQDELEKGNRLALEERYVEALYHYRRALEFYPGYSQARYNMARVQARMGEREMALATYREFLAAEPFHPLARKAQEAIREIESGGSPS